MYRAGSERTEAETLKALDRITARLELSNKAQSFAQELFLSQQQIPDRSKYPLLAACIYAGALIAGEQRSQTEVAKAAGVSRLSIQSRWQKLLEDAGFEPPTW